MKKINYTRGLLVFLTLCMFVMAFKEAHRTLQEREKETMIKYIECLKENFTQRDYCARKLNESYTFLDRKIVDYGYCYVSDGVNLYIQQLGGSNE